jgi:hypothetical protein
VRQNARDLEQVWAVLWDPSPVPLGQRRHVIPGLRFLVSMLGIETLQGWRIAVLFTTAEQPK